MIITLLIVVLLLSTLFYVLFLGRVQFGLRSLTLPQISSAKDPFVSVVVAARNEEGTIATCVEAILNQQYPANLLELIVVNDDSADETELILKKIGATNANVRLISLHKDQDVDSGGKPAAISVGVNVAKGDVILTTDADCIVPPTWVGTMVHGLQPGVAFAAGPVREETNQTLISRIGHLELLGLITTAAGLIGARHPIICNGANLAYRKSAYLAAQGGGGNRMWCDDETLMQRIHTRQLGEIVFVPSSDAMVRTSPNVSLVSFWKQRLRWSAMGGHHEQSSTLMLVLGLYLFFLLLLVSFVTSYFYTELRIWLFFSFVTKLAIDYSTLVAGARVFRDRISIMVFLVAEILHVPYIVITAALGQIASFNWKGRTISS